MHHSMYLQEKSLIRKLVLIQVHYERKIKLAQLPELRQFSNIILKDEE